MKRNHLVRIFFILTLIVVSSKTEANDLFLEAENFNIKGGWVIDQQFMDQMGSPYLLAHGYGKPVAEAYTEVHFPKKGKYHVYVRTFNWTSAWTTKPGPGKFQLGINGSKLPTILGNNGSKWMWQKAGVVNIENNKNTTITLHDLTGFDGRIDAIYFTQSRTDFPPSDSVSLSQFRRNKLKVKNPTTKKFDFVVVGGGTAGMCAAVAAARNGLRVALIHNRPIFGGNNSSEVRVHLGGKVNVGKYPNLGNLVREFGPSTGGNAKAAEIYENNLKISFLEAEKNISLFSNFHVFTVKMHSKNQLKSLTAKSIISSEEIIFESPIFADCTGDGSVGFLARADFSQGCESYDTYKEQRAPSAYEKRTMGSSVQWYANKTQVPTKFPEFEYGVKFNSENSEKITMGEWTWETGMNYNQINEFERIRDYGMLVVYSNWSFLKNKLENNSKFKTYELSWVAYIGGKRESRRLLGDIVLNQNDLDNYVEYLDGTAATTWTVDLHYPDPLNTKNFPGEEFKSIAKHTKIYPYPIPYRCFYSRNINNLFMAGRNISVSHIALGTVRVMRTTAMMGEVVGLAASVCMKNNCFPRSVYQNYWTELDALLQIGAGKTNAPDNQNYNFMENLKIKPNSEGEN